MAQIFCEVYKEEFIILFCDCNLKIVIVFCFLFKRATFSTAENSFRNK